MYPRLCFCLWYGLGRLRAVLPDGRAVCLRRNPGTHWTVQWSRLFAGLNLCGGTENDLAVLLHPKSWFHLVPLGRREQSWPRIGVALEDVLNGGNASYGSFLHVFCKVGWWCRPPLPPACTQCCSREQLFVLPCGNEVIISSSFQFCCFGMSMPISCFCFRDVNDFTKSHSSEHYARLLQGRCLSAADSQCEFVLSTIAYPPGLNFYPFNSGVIQIFKPGILRFSVHAMNLRYQR